MGEQADDNRAVSLEDIAREIRLGLLPFIKNRSRPTDKYGEDDKRVEEAIVRALLKEKALFEEKEEESFGQREGLSVLNMFEALRPVCLFEYDLHSLEGLCKALTSIADSLREHEKEVTDYFRGLAEEEE